MSISLYVDADAISYDQALNALAPKQDPSVIHAFFSYQESGNLKKWKTKVGDSRLMLHLPNLSLNGKNGADHLLLAQLGHDTGRNAFSLAIVMTGDLAIMQGIMLLRKLGGSIAIIGSPSATPLTNQNTKKLPTLEVLTLPLAFLKELALLSEKDGRINVQMIGSLLAGKPELLHGLKRPKTGLGKWLIRDPRLQPTNSPNFIRIQSKMG